MKDNPVPTTGAKPKSRFFREEVTVGAAPAAVMKAVLARELTPFFEKPGCFRSSPAILRWSSPAPAACAVLIGGFPWWTYGTAFFLHRYRIELMPSGSGTSVTIAVERTPLGSVLVPITYAMWCLLCIVGVIVPIVMFSRVEGRLAQWGEKIRDALLAWTERAQIGR